MTRPEIRLGLRRAALDEAVVGNFSARCRREVRPSVEGEIAELRAVVRDPVPFAVGVLLVAAALLSDRFLPGFSTAISSGEIRWLVAYPNIVVLTVLGSVLLFLFRVTSVRMRRRGKAARDLRVALETLLVPLLRREINARIDIPFHKLEVREAIGLSETVDPSLEVATRASTDLSGAMQRMGSGAIGISGSRGAGKSTLIRAACGGRLPLGDRAPTIGVSVSAPVRWQANEFVPLLFAELCKSVAPDLRDDARRRITAPVLARAYVLVGLAVLLGMLALKIGSGALRVRAEQVVAVALGLSALTLLNFAFPPLEPGLATPLEAVFDRMLNLRSNTRRRGLERAAARHLRELRFRETVVQGWSLGAKSMMGLSLGRRQELTAERQPLTLPEVVASYKAFVRRVAAEHTLVIGIDELDKMESAEEAARFLTEVKVLFGEQPCFYLVSVSDDAMSEFERRGVPLRTVFDSTFDDVLHVETLSFTEALALVNGRVVGMGDGHVAVCFMLGDGVPRELIRCVRGALRASEHGARTPGEVARTLAVDRQQRIERAAAAVAARSVAVDGCHPLRDWLRGLASPDADTLAARWEVADAWDAVGTVTASEEERDAHRMLLLELATVAYRAASVIEVADRLDEPILAASVNLQASGSPLALLARAGRDLAQGPRMAWQTVDAARAVAGLECVAFPLGNPDEDVEEATVLS